MTFEDLKDEIKKEDFLKKLQKNIPALFLIFISTLIVTGIITWRSHRYEENLMHAEILYEKALDLKTQGDHQGAIIAFKKLEKSHKGISALCQLHLSSLETAVDFDNSTPWLYEFKTMADGLTHLKGIKDQGQNFKSHQSPWYDVYGLYESLMNLKKNDLEALYSSQNWLFSKGHKKNDQTINPLQLFLKIGLMEV